jgi:hypothetical protein
MQRKLPLLLSGIALLACFTSISQASWLDDLGFNLDEASILSPIFSADTLKSFMKDYGVDVDEIKDLLTDPATITNLMKSGGSTSGATSTTSTKTNTPTTNTNDRDDTDNTDEHGAATTLRGGEDYDYKARNCKTYRITYLSHQNVYTSPDFKNEMFFVAPAYIERYIDSKNPGNCTNKRQYATNPTFSNKSELRYIAPNGKIYYTDTDGKKWFSNEMESITKFSSLKALQNVIFSKNAQLSM